MIFHMISPTTHRSKITVVSSKKNIVQDFVPTKTRHKKSHKTNNKTKQATNKKKGFLQQGAKKVGPRGGTRDFT